MTRAILTCWHKYQPYGGEYYEPILDFFIASMEKYKDEYDKIYFLDSNWEIDPKKLAKLNAEIIRINPSHRYYEAYKETLPQVKEDLVLFMDNDMVVYKENVIAITFSLLDICEVVSIYDTIGDYKTDKLNGKNKFCPYWFATSKKLLMKYLDVDWGAHMPHSETLGKLTEAMLNDGVNPYEWEEDKSSLYFDGTSSEEKGKNLGYYHIRAGSVPAVLLAWKKEGSEEYQKYLKDSPRNEYLRQMAWYWQMIQGEKNFERRVDFLNGIITDVGLSHPDWFKYKDKFHKYHGL